MASIEVSVAAIKTWFTTYWSSDAPDSMFRLSRAALSATPASHIQVYAPEQPLRMGTTPSPSPFSMSSLPNDAIGHIASYLGPKDRLNLALTSNRLGRNISEKFMTEMSRRNIELLEKREIVLKTFYDLCLGCEDHCASSELITGLSLCKACVKNHPYLGVTSRTTARREYMLNDDDLSRLGDRSAVIEYDSQLGRVYRVHFYRRALFKKAKNKFGGLDGFLQEKGKRSSKNKKRSQSIAARRHRRLQEIVGALSGFGLRTKDVYASILPADQKRRVLLLPWEIELDNAAQQYTNRKNSDLRLAGALARATAVKVFFRDMTEYAPIFSQDRARDPSAPLPDIQATAFAKSLQLYFLHNNASLENWEALPLPDLLKDIVRTSLYSSSSPTSVSPTHYAQTSEGVQTPSQSS